MKPLAKPLIGAALAAACACAAADDASCRTVRFVDIGWTDITATTAVAMAVFEGIGYKPTKTIASVPISFAGLKSKQVDVSLGYWWPIQQAAIEPFVQAKSIQVLEPPNLAGAKTTLAVPRAAWEAGLKSFADIAKFKDQLDGKIYGIESGSSANNKIKKMIDSNQFGLGAFKLVESSEAGMLISVAKAAREKKPIVFLGWEPHPMNVQMEINYLDGGDEVFGANYGEARVYTLLAPDYQARCPNAGRLIANLRFTTDMENRLMASIMDKEQPADVARAFLKKNPQLLEQWLAGVQSFDGKDALPAAKVALGL